MYSRRLAFQPSNLLIGFIILYGISPAVSRFTSSTISTYGYLLILVTAFLMIIGYNINDYLASILPLCGYCALTFFTRSESLVLWGFQSFLFVMPVLIGVYVIYEPHNSIKGFSRLIIFSFLATIITTIEGVIQYPSAARYLATVEDSNDSFNVLLELHNVGGFTFVYMVVLIYPMLIFAYKRKKIKKITLILGIFTAFATALFTEYTTALLLLIISTVFLFLKRDLQIKEVMLLFVVLVVAFFFLKNLMSSALQWLSGIVSSKDISERLMALSGGSSGLESFDDDRVFRYQISFKVFLRNPLFGRLLWNTSRIGGHSAILDSLANYGIFGAGVMFLMYRKIYNLFYRPYKGESGYGYYFWSFIQAILLSCLNTGFWISALAIYLPFIFISIIGEDKNESTLDY